MAKRKDPRTRTFDAQPDPLDFRDRMYSASLFEVPQEKSISEFKALKIPVLDQGTEGACTGFGLATVANYLLSTRKQYPDLEPVSPRMLYEMARRYDEWEGEDYSGSSARGAMKGWFKHGICSEKFWPYSDSKKSILDSKRTLDALNRPLGAYFRVNHKDLVSMHTAISEVGILYATSQVHQGWSEVGVDGKILLSDQLLGGHAFALVAYDRDGFWFQNSWGPDWGNDGYAHISYDDWLRNGTDVWVARLGAAVNLKNSESKSFAFSSARSRAKSNSLADLRPHIISIGNDGVLSSKGDFANSKEDVDHILLQDFPAITKNWKKKRILLYAHGGLVSEDAAVQRLDEYREAMLKAEVYPVSFVWHSDFWTTLTNIIQDAFRRKKPEGFLDAAKDFMLDRLDDTLEILARNIGGKSQWDEMKENAYSASGKEGGARYVIRLLKKLNETMPLEIHIVGHSAGSVFHAPLIDLITGDGKDNLILPIETCTLWAPACTTDLFKSHYLPAIKSGRIKKFSLFTLTDQAEQDDNCAKIYNKSLLYMVSNAFEVKAKRLLGKDGEAILGMEKFIKQDKEISALFSSGKSDWILSPNSNPVGGPDSAGSTSHGGFDDDPATLKSTLHRIINTGKNTAGMNFHFANSLSFNRERRSVLNNSGLLK